jgi:hypothetical protein
MQWYIHNNCCHELFQFGMTTMANLFHEEVIHLQTNSMHKKFQYGPIVTIVTPYYLE